MRALWLWASLAVSCSGGEEPAARRQDPAPQATESPSRNAPAMKAPSAPSTNPAGVGLTGGGPTTVGAQPTATTEPDGGCTETHQQLLSPSAGSSGTAWSGGTLFVAVLTAEDGKASLRIGRVVAADTEQPAAYTGTSQQVSAQGFSWEQGGPSISARGSTAIVALATVPGRVLLGRVPQQEAPTPLVTVAESADPRFAVALGGRAGQPLLAYVRKGRTMRVSALWLSANLAVERSRDVTPAGMGAAAPLLLSGGSGALADLVVIDAREGLSPVVRIPLGPRGNVGEPEVLYSLSTVTQPPRFAIAKQANNDAVKIAYVAVGRAATTAIGLVSAPGTAAPTALVPGTGYGTLSVAAAGPLFAVTVAQGSRPEDPRSLELRLAHDAPTTPRARVAGPAKAPALSTDGSGHYALSYATPDGVWLKIFRCAAH